MSLVQNINGTSTAIAGESRGGDIFYIIRSSLSDFFVTKARHVHRFEGRHDCLWSFPSFLQPLEYGD